MTRWRIAAYENKAAARQESQRPRSEPDEFGIIWQLSEYPFKLRAGDIFRFEDRLCRVIRVNYSCAVVIMNRPVRVFKTRFDKPVRFQPPPKRFYISPDSEVAVLNRKARR